jgi:hypothetical protein
MNASLLLWPFFWLILIVTLWYVFAELYHWIRYGWMYPLVWIAMPIYLVGVVVLIGAMLSAIGAA